jgi:hypothetical protein
MPDWLMPDWLMPDWLMPIHSLDAYPPTLAPVYSLPMIDPALHMNHRLIPSLASLDSTENARVVMVAAWPKNLRPGLVRLQISRWTRPSSPRPLMHDAQPCDAPSGRWLSMTHHFGNRAVSDFSVRSDPRHGGGAGSLRRRVSVTDHSPGMYPVVVRVIPK